MKGQEELNKIFLEEALRLDQIDQKALYKIRCKIAREFKVPFPTNIALLKTYQKLLKTKKVKPNLELEKILKTRPIRNLSGIAVIAVLTKPYPCPGNCIFCPTQKDIPKSYLDNEPAVMRAVLNQFDPYKQVKMRLKALKMGGHLTDKIELIVIGGTFSALKKDYQEWFIKRCFDAMNHKTAKDLKESQKLNEKAKNRCIGLTLETRPDWIDLAEIKNMRKLGATRVEVGVQHINDKILKLNQRGHLVQKTIQATRLLKDAGFKICYHLMPNLLGSTPEKDLQMFKEIFNDPNFQPDKIKIYPCVVIENTQLYKLWKAGKYKSYSPKQLENLIAKVKAIVPPYVRILRLIRDIPGTEIVGGNKIPNLRQLMQERGIKCQCIRCREAREKNINPKDLIYSKIEYQTLGGKEIFLQYTSKDKQTLFAFLRLRLPDWKTGKFLDSLKGTALLRELHTYGQLVPLDNKIKYTQHRGLGRKLVEKAEEISKKAGFKEIAVISGVGVREYYRDLGYSVMNKDQYLVKKL
ncbi:elongator complex protein 3 [Patescibacteria group bacterium]